MLAILAPCPGSSASFDDAAITGASSSFSLGGGFNVSVGRAASAVRPGGSSPGAQATAASTATRGRQDRAKDRHRIEATRPGDVGRSALAGNVLGGRTRLAA